MFNYSTGKEEAVADRVLSDTELAELESARVWRTATGRQPRPSELAALLVSLADQLAQAQEALAFTREAAEWVVAEMEDRHEVGFSKSVNALKAALAGQPVAPPEAAQDHGGETLTGTPGTGGLRPESLAAVSSPVAPPEAEARLHEAERAKNGAYHERNQVVAALSKLFPAALEPHQDVPGEEWDEKWRWVVRIDLPTGQVSWHIEDAEIPLFEHLHRVDGSSWDGHSTEEKYARLAALVPSAVSSPVPARWPVPDCAMCREDEAQAAPPVPVDGAEPRAAIDAGICRVHGPCLVWTQDGIRVCSVCLEPVQGDQGVLGGHLPWAYSPLKSGRE